MEITDLEVLTYQFPIEEAWDTKPDWYRDWHYAGSGWDWSVEARQECIVKVHTDEGITGIGASDKTHKDARVVATVIERVLKPELIGEDPTDIERLWEKMWKAGGMHITGAKGIGHGAMGGIDVACWDILGKQAGMPVYELLGGDKDIPVKPYIGTFTHGWRELDDIDSLVREAEYYVDQGYEAIKFRGGRAGSEDIASISALRERFSPEELTLMMDVNGGYNQQEALRMARELEEYDLFWMEDPFESRDYQKYAEFQEKVNINVFIGGGPTSMELSRMIQNGATTNLASISTEHAGGITEAKKVAALINSWDLKTAAISHEPLGSLPTFHVWKAVPPKIIENSYVEYDPENGCWDELLTDPPKFEDGELILSDKPGIGTDVNDDFIENHPIPESPTQNMM